MITGTLLSVVPPALLGAGLLHRPWAAGSLWLLPVTAPAVAEVPTRLALRADPTHALAIRE